MTYFKLNPECYLISGKAKAAIYDLITGNVFGLNEKEKEVLVMCENGVPVENIRGGKNILEEVCDKLLGEFYPNRIFVEKLRLGSPIHDYQPGNPIELERVFLEINNSCDYDCWFCGYHGIRRTLGCFGCNKWKENGEPMSVDRVKRLVKEIKKLGCKILYITGGDLTLDWDRTLEIAECAENLLDKVYIMLNEKKISTVIEDLNELKVHPVIQTEIDSMQKAFGLNSFTILLVTTPDEFEKARSASQRLLKEVDRNITIKVDFVSKDFGLLKSHKTRIPLLKIPRVNTQVFWHNKKWHPCLGKSLAITYDGRVLPCPMMRNYSFGNIKDKELYKIFEGKKEIEKFWNLTLDNIEKCKGCEFRYACSDCRALEENLTGKLKGKRLCNYEPEEGK